MIDTCWECKCEAPYQYNPSESDGCEECSTPRPKGALKTVLDDNDRLERENRDLAKQLHDVRGRLAGATLNREADKLWYSNYVEQRRLKEEAQAELKKAKVEADRAEIAEAEATKQARRAEQAEDDAAAKTEAFQKTIDAFAEQTNVSTEKVTAAQLEASVAKAALKSAVESAEHWKDKHAKIANWNGCETCNTSEGFYCKEYQILLDGIIALAER